MANKLKMFLKLSLIQELQVSVVGCSVAREMLSGGDGAGKGPGTSLNQGPWYQPSRKQFCGVVQELSEYLCPLI